MKHTLIQSNGSKWIGEPPDSIETLIQILGEHPLNKTFERYGNFFYRIHSEDFVNPLSDFANEWNGAMHFFGNFYDISHVFNIYTFDQEIIEKLIEAIENNRQKKDYINQGRK